MTMYLFANEEYVPAPEDDGISYSTPIPTRWTRPTFLEESAGPHGSGFVQQRAPLPALCPNIQKASGSGTNVQPLFLFGSSKNACFEPNRNSPMAEGSRGVSGSLCDMRLLGKSDAWRYSTTVRHEEVRSIRQSTHPSTTDAFYYAGTVMLAGRAGKAYPRTEPRSWNYSAVRIRR